MRKSWQYLAATVLACIAISPLAADTQAGVDAWEAGDYERAVLEWVEPAAQGNADAQFNLAQAYRMGRGVERDAAKAEELYAAAAAQGNLRAADNYGILLYLRGKQEAALPLVVAAASRGDPRAQYLLGTAYFNGGEVERDYPRAYAYMTLASRAGLSQATQALEGMEGHVSTKDREAGTRLTAALAQGGSVASEAGSGLRRSRAANDDRPNAARSTPGAQLAGLTSDWKVQLGAFAINGNADRMWQKVSNRPELEGKSRLDQSAGRLTVLFATGFANLAEARRVCRTLKRRDIECLVTR